MIIEGFSRCGGEGLLARKPGGGGGEVAAHSLFGRPIPEDREAHGRSRRWGDAAAEVQQQVIEQLIRAAEGERFSLSNTAFLLAVARTESGFNPDAAARTTSASGLGQLIRKTAASLGIAEADRFSIGENIRGLITLAKQELAWADRQGAVGLEKFSLAYARYHDGPALDHGGRSIGERVVIPSMQKALLFLQCLAGDRKIG
jgi:putative chitinase